MRRDERFGVGARAQLDVEIAAGHLQVVAATGHEIHVSVDATTANELDITQIGDTVSIRRNARWSSRGRSIRMVIEVPGRAAVSIKGGSLDVSLRGLLGEVRCRTSSGDVDIDDVDRLEMFTASGEVRVRSIAGDAGFSTASGDVTVTTVMGRLTAQLSSGDLDAGAVGSSVDVGTASGDVRIGRCDGSEINVKTVSGDISLGLPAGIRVDPDISTMSGKVTLPTGTSPTPDRSAERRSVRLRLRTVSGDVRVERAG